VITTRQPASSIRLRRDSALNPPKTTLLFYFILFYFYFLFFLNWSAVTKSATKIDKGKEWKPMDNPKARASKHCNGSLRDVRKIYSHPIPFSETDLFHHIGKKAHLVKELRIGDCSNYSWFVSLMNNSNLPMSFPLGFFHYYCLLPYPQRSNTLFGVATACLSTQLKQTLSSPS